MGFDLQVMASYFREKGGELLPTATVRFERDDELFSRLRAESVPCVVRPLPQGFKVGCYEDQGLRFTDVDAYGKPLTFTTPKDLLDGRFVPEDAVHPWSRATLSYLLALPKDNRIGKVVPA
jgi:hypothetical protein